MEKARCRVRAEDSTYLDHSASAIFRAITDFASYSDWWPRLIRFRPLRLSEDYVGSRIEVRSFVVARFLYEIEQAKADREIVVKYGGGNLTGCGRWTIRENGAGATVCYEIDLAPRTWTSLLVAKYLHVGELHSRLMSRAFDGLGAYLDRKRAVAD